MTQVYAGLMTGTSMDGVDCVLATFESRRAGQLLYQSCTAFSPQIQRRLKDLLAAPDPQSALAQELDHELGMLYAEALLEAMAATGMQKIAAAGCHGQTIIHCPDADPPCSWQLGDGTVIASRTGLPVVIDFRTADMRAGGQGAPLAPAFHQSVFASDRESRAVVNIGGIANATCLPANACEPVLGFDTGPGNALLDQWIWRHRGLPYDESGRWALTAAVDIELLSCLLDDPYFNQPIPKSLDCRYFSMDWLAAKMSTLHKKPDPAAVQMTLAALTADTIAMAIEAWMAPVKTIYLCGGGINNAAIVMRLKEVSKRKVMSTEQLGIPPEMVEACAFAWLAMRRMSNLPANLPSVTGASREVQLGRVIMPD